MERTSHKFPGPSLSRLFAFGLNGPSGIEPCPCHGSRVGHLGKGVGHDHSLTLAGCATEPIVLDNLLFPLSLGVCRRVQLINEVLVHVHDDYPTFVLLS